MDRQTRVQKYKKLREEINQMDTYKFDNPYHVEEEYEDLNDVGMSNEELQTEHIKKSTLSISIDQIVKAHDEYTTIIEQKELKEKLRLEKKERLLTRVKRILKITGIALALVLIFSVLFFVILTILK